MPQWLNSNDKSALKLWHGRLYQKISRLNNYFFMAFIHNETDILNINTLEFVLNIVDTSNKRNLPGIIFLISLWVLKSWKHKYISLKYHWSLNKNYFFSNISGVTAKSMKLLSFLIYLVRSIDLNRAGAV